MAIRRCCCHCNCFFCPFHLADACLSQIQPLPHVFNGAQDVAHQGFVTSNPPSPSHPQLLTLLHGVPLRLRVVQLSVSIICSIRQCCTRRELHQSCEFQNKQRMIVGALTCHNITLDVADHHSHNHDKQLMEQSLTQ